jgi:hypothetical protein
MKLATLFVSLSAMACAANLSDQVTAHEWGTFTSVAAADGKADYWAPLSGTPDLPCFVERLSTRDLKQVNGLVRMETPVLYFYSPRAATLSVHVDFPKGWITEWYPQASRVTPNPAKELAPGSYTDGRLEWNNVQVLPGERLTFPTSKAASRYYAARETDSAPLRIGNQQEKLIFYRGIGNFQVPLRPRFTSDGKLEIANSGSQPLALAIVFENRGGKMGYRVVRGLSQSVSVDLPELNATAGSIREELTRDLIQAGLYDKEARAMLATWHDSWFEEGTRVFYILPRAEVDSILPLNIQPAPASLQRVFVGRVEVLAPWMKEEMKTNLTRFGRFAEPFARQFGRQINVPGPASAMCVE